MLLSLNGNEEFKPRFCRWLQTGKVKEIPLRDLATFDSLSMQRRLEARSRMESRTIVCYVGGIWRRLEPLERNYGRFPSVDPLGRFAGVPNLGKP